MRNIIKKRLTLLLGMMLMTTMYSFSTTLNGIEQDSIVSLTPLQLKETNLIFAEHHKLLIENKLLKEQVYNYQEDNSLLLKKDSIRYIQNSMYKELNNSLNNSINKKNKKLKLWKIGSITTNIGLLLLLLFFR